MFAQTGETRLSEAAAVLALAAATDGPWYRTASLIEDAGSAVRILDRGWSGFELMSEAELTALIDRVPPESVTRYRELIEQYEGNGTRLVSILDEAYPANLRHIFNRPPFLFIKGDLREEDTRALAVVGTRQASERGRAMAGELSSKLASRGVTILSGLARGIDAAAHKAALDASGRTVAVMGTGIDRVYPSEHELLANEIVSSGGALVSQFMPDSSPSRYSFPMRNVVMSGMSLGTVVVEASATSGAKLQARLALEHGKRVYLMRSLVLAQEWAQRYSERPGVRVIDSIEELLGSVVESTAPAAQLTLR